MLCQPCFAFCIFQIGVANYLPGLVLNHNPPDLCLLSSWDYRCEPQVPDPIFDFEETLRKGAAQE
jgi:hypothetical protein